MSTSDCGTYVGPRDASPFPTPERRHYLVVVRGNDPGLRVELGDGEIVIGRDRGCGIALTDRELSKRHCAVALRGDRVFVTDLGSTNGSYIDGDSLQSAGVLPIASILQVGGHLLRHEFRDRADVEREVAVAADLRRARAYVEAMLPARRVEGAVRTDWVFVPCAALGGDAFGVHELPGGAIAFYLIDVCGHGAAAAMHSVTAIKHIRSGGPEADRAEPSRLLSALNTTFGMDEHDGMYFSMWYGVWDPATRLLRYASAGHPPSLLLSPDCAARQAISTRNPPIGAIPQAAFEEASLRVAPGSRLYLFSDGAFEIRTSDGRDWGYEDFARLVTFGPDREPPDAQALHAQVMLASATARLEDDLTILTVAFD